MSYSTDDPSGHGVLPRQPPIEHVPQEQISVAINRNAVSDELRVVSSETAQQILATLSDEPRTASNLAEQLDASVQNVTYHLDRLDDAGIITPVETWYSEKGREMTVYGVTSEKLVVDFGSTEDVTNSSHRDQSA